MGVYRDLETPRLYLRCVSPDDREFIYRQFSDPSVCRYLYDEEPYAKIEEADALISFYTQPEPRDRHRWILALRESGEKIGTCGFHRVNDARGVAEMGYDLQALYRGRGLMTEAASACLDFARTAMRLNEIRLHISFDNEPSLRLAKRLGFQESGETVQYEFRGVNYPHWVYALPLKAV